MSASTLQDDKQASLNFLISSAALRSSKISLDLNEAKRRRPIRSFIVWPLVVLSLVQVTSNIVSYHNKSSLSIAGSHLYNKQLLKDRVCQANGIFECAIDEEYTLDSPKDLANDLRTRESSHRQISDSNFEIYSCSSNRERFLSLNDLLSCSLTYLSDNAVKVTYNISTFLNQIISALDFGPKILFANAAQISSNTVHQANSDREIIVLNSTNFNAELIQHNHPFPHIKLLEYYLAYCGICLKFRPTYVQLAKEIHPWRNVIRTAAIDLGVSSNTLIASSYSIDVIPTLRIHPPPSSSVASKLFKQLSAPDTSSLSSDQLKSLSDNYNAANLDIGSLGVTRYTYDAKKENLVDKVALLKRDLLAYIERYVSKHPDDLPSTWPNLRPVREETLIDLRRNHPRQELFLIIEAGNVDSTGLHQSDLTKSQPSLGLQILMELSSSAPYKAIRHVRASENRALIMDVIAHKRKESSEQVTDAPQSNDQNVISNEQVVLLQKFLDSKTADQQDQVLLIHIDDSRSPYGHSSSTPSNKFPSITVVTGTDLVYAEQQYKSLDLAVGSNDARSKRAVINQDVAKRTRRALLYNDDHINMSLQRNLELVTRYINQTYIEVREDREFLKALNSFDENPTSSTIKREAVEKFRSTQQENQKSLSKNIKKSKQHEEDVKASNSSLNQFFNRLNPSSSKTFLNMFGKSHQADFEDDYEDKLKAIRYIFFQEVPRKTLAEKSPVEKLERLNTFINLTSVIKAYFPLPDMASVQFIDGILSYLKKQQSLIAATVGDQQDGSSSTSGSNFDFRALKQVIKNLEAEGKRLPEVGQWKLCSFGGYPCALWRLFHTLTAFEYKKLSQISQQSHFTPRQVLRDHQNLTMAAVGATVENQASTSGSPTQGLKSPTGASEGNNGPPVERLVSPPSTTTSLSLTIATPITAQDQHATNDVHNNNGKQVSEADLPEPVLLVMRDYVTHFFSCEECARNFRQEAAELTFEKVRRQEPAEFSILWLWEAHNRISKRLSVSNETNSPEHPKKWYPTFEQCPKCYNKPPSYLKDTNVELAAIFHESIDWNREEVLSFLVNEFTRQPMDMEPNLFGYPVPYGFNYIVVIGISSLVLIMLLRYASCYIERQRRHKATLLNGNGTQYSVELQRS